MRVYIVRHGQTAWNLRQIWQGNTDIPLDEIGVLQANKLAERLCNLPIKCIYTSPLCRSASTAKIINERISAELIYLDEMKEIRLGKWEGYTSEQLMKQYKVEFTEWDTNAEAKVAFGVENYATLQDRSFKTFQQICVANETVLLVGHGTWIRALLCKLLNIPIYNRMNFEVSNTGISVVDVIGKDYKVVTLNDTSHLSNIFLKI